MTVIDWLLDADPALRWQVLRDLTDASAETVAAERARVATEGWGARLLALQAPDGRWGGAAWNRGWDSTMHVLLLLRDFGLDPTSDQARRSVALVRERVTWRGCGPTECDGNAFFAGDAVLRRDAGRSRRRRGPAEPLDHPARPAGAPLVRRGQCVRAPDCRFRLHSFDAWAGRPNGEARPTDRGGMRMRDIVVSTFVTLDGVMQAPGGPEEDQGGGFAHGGWSGGYWDDMQDRAMGASLARPFDLLLGRKTYEIFAAYWPHASGEAFADALNRARKYVVSTTLDTADWQPSTIIRPGERDLPEQLRRLKAQDGPELQVHGSGRLIQTLLAHDLVDRYFLKIYPVLLGTGKRLFGAGAAPAGLRLLGSETSTTGVILATYERAGAVRTGSFAPEPSNQR